MKPIIFCVVNISSKFIGHLRKHSWKLSKSSNEIFWYTVWARYSSLVAKFLLINLFLPIKQLGNPLFKPFKLRLIPDRLKTEPVAELAVIL